MRHSGFGVARVRLTIIRATGGPGRRTSVQYDAGTTWKTEDARLGVDFQCLRHQDLASKARQSKLLASINTFSH